MQVDGADVLPPPRWTMSVALSRKRSRLGVDDDEEEEQRRREPSPAFSDSLKRSKTQCELEELDVIGAEEAWGVDVDAILASRRIMKPGFEAHDNWARYGREESIVVLCVQGNVLVHYELLWYTGFCGLGGSWAHERQRDVTGSLQSLAVSAGVRPLPRAFYAQAASQRAVFAPFDTSGRAVKQPLRTSGSSASTGRRKVPAGRAGCVGPTRTTETSFAVWLGRWQARWHTSWPGDTDAVDGAVKTLCGDVGARAMTMFRSKMIPRCAQNRSRRSKTIRSSEG